MYTKHHKPPCDGLHFATFMFSLVHRLCGCRREFLCTRFKVKGNIGILTIEAGVL